MMFTKDSAMIQRVVCIVFLCCLSVVGVYGKSYAGTDLYLEGKFFIGTQKLSVDRELDSGGWQSKVAFPIRWGGGAAIGTRFDCKLIALRAEVEYLYKRVANTFTFLASPQKRESKFSVDTHGVLANFYLDLTMIPIVKPYISAGIGLAVSQGKYVPATLEFKSGGSTRVTRTRFAWQTGVGLYAQLGKVALDLNIRYAYTDPLRITAYRAKSYASPHALEALLGIIIFL